MPRLSLETRGWRPGGPSSACALGGGARRCPLRPARLRTLGPQPLRCQPEPRGGSGIEGHVTSTNPVTKLCFPPQHKPLLRRLPARSPLARSRGRAGVDERGTAAAEALPRSPRPPPLGPLAMADGGGTSSSGSWWSSLKNSRKKSKDAAGGGKPPAQPDPGEPAAPAPPGPDWTSSSRENQHPNLLGGAGEPHKPDKLGGEKSGNSRRNLKISRSGRFKEKRKVRATLLPEGVRSSEEASFSGDPHDDKQ